MTTTTVFGKALRFLRVSFTKRRPQSRTATVRRQHGMWPMHFWPFVRGIDRWPVIGEFPAQRALWGESTGHRWIPRTKGQWHRKSFHLMTSSWCGSTMFTWAQWTTFLQLKRLHLKAVQWIANLPNDTIETNWCYDYSSPYIRSKLYPSVFIMLIYRNSLLEATFCEFDFKI